MKRQPRILAGTAIGLFMASAPLSALPLPNGTLPDAGTSLPLVRVQSDCQEGESAEACSARQGGQQAPAEEPAPAPEPEPQPAPEPAPEPEPAHQPEPAPEPAPEPEPAPAPEPQAEQPAPEPEAAPEQAAPEQQEQAPAAEQPAPEAEPAPEPQAEQPAEKPAEQPAEQPAPEQQEQAPAAEQPAPQAEPQPEPKAEQPAEQPAEKPAEQPAEATPEQVPTPAPAPETTAPAGEAPAQGEAPAAEQPKAEQPASGEQPAAGEQPASGEQPAAGEQPATGEQPAAGEQPAQQGEAPVNPNEAPILDSQKETPPAPAGGEQPAAEGQPAQPAQEGQPAPEGQAGGQAAQPLPAPVDPGPPPVDDKAAAEQAQPVEIQAITAEQGTRIERMPEVDLRRRPRPEGTEVVREIGDRVIIQINNQVIVESNDRPRLTRNAQEVYYEELPRGRTREVIVRENGNQIITIRNRYGDIVQRSRITPDGREYVLSYVDDQYYGEMDEWRDPGLDLPPLQLHIPRNEYILDAQYVEDEDAYYDFLEQPPVERVKRLYSVDEVKRSARVRDIARRVDLDTLNFEFGSASIPEAEVAKLEGVANAMDKLLKKNPAETFLIEGHTDAVGSDVANLALSDRRAEAVADALSNVFGIPPENLSTQGYGERYLKVKTDQRERENRRVAIRRITPLVAPIASAK